MTSKQKPCTDVGRVSPQGVTRQDMHQKGPFSLYMPSDLYRKSRFSIQVIGHLHGERLNPMHSARGRHV